jgi:serine/threonine protein kinase
MRRMSQPRWEKIEETFHAALERPASDREAFLNTTCSGDPELRREVESLLDEFAKAGSFMDRPMTAQSIATMSLMSLEGRKLNHYQLGSLIGSGGMAEVYRARDTKLRRDVAIKILHDAPLMDRERLDAMYREARVLASLNHPNIASIYGVEEGDGLCGLVLEFVEGETLADRLRHGPLGIGEALHVGRQIVAGLRAAHARGIIHRDLKPSNIKMSADGTVKIVDFGIAKLLRSIDTDENLSDLSRSGVIVGTVAYMSPEQARGKPVDARTDVWAFGCVMYEVLTGKAAFHGDSPTDIIVRIATEEPDWENIQKLASRDSADVAYLIRKCLHKDPGMRYASVEEIVGYLEAIRPDSLYASVSKYAASAPVVSDFALPRRPAMPLFLLTQAGYLALYVATMYHYEAVARILSEDFLVPEMAAVITPPILAMCGVAIRIYLMSAVGWHHPLAARKFTLLFPFLLVFDGIWAASPLLLHRRIGFGVAFICVALLAYVPFGYRTLLHAIYPPQQRL